MNAAWLIPLSLESLPLHGRVAHFGLRPCGNALNVAMLAKGCGNANPAASPVGRILENWRAH